MNAKRYNTSFVAHHCPLGPTEHRTARNGHRMREPRKVTIHPNLAAWLKAYPPDKTPITPANLQHVWARIAKTLGLSHDIMRHTFISMFVAKSRSIGEAAIQAGNSETIIRKHYLV